MRSGGISGDEIGSGAIARHIASQVYLEEEDPEFESKLADAVR